MVIIGEITRKLAIVTAGQAFTHLIKVNHEDQHNLITHGVYRFVRHPSYTGFLIWSVGTQIMLCNPISTIGFAIVVWRFFAQRIPYEEFFLEAVFWVGVRGICFENSFWNSICEVKFLWSLHTELNSFATLILFHGERFRKVPVILCGRDLELVRS
ncbi:PROTEIN-S ISOPRENYLCYSTEINE O-METHYLTRANSFERASE [Salix koriyanagi]|uniref:Protein-S-isoprenylcysteine O-methyltransferase n=1 Tax=Salix koriyanagi TaxID=2511006 RepID=A0A9Q0ZGD2_9ROSI|nr:PROTEIN-S ISOPRENYLCYSTEINE O-METHYLTRANSFERASE [Salix koriyanagi]